MKINKQKNDKIIELLKGREAHFNGYLEELDENDDYTVYRHNAFMAAYNKLSKLEQDIWYLSVVYTQAECAKLYQVDKSTICLYMKKINKKLKEEGVI